MEPFLGTSTFDGEGIGARKRALALVPWSFHGQPVMTSAAHEQDQQPIYKIFLPEQFAALKASGDFHGSRDDRRDGFIHLSFRDQVEGSIAKHFSERNDLVIAELDSSKWGETLRFEPSRRGRLFPHLYGQLRYEDVLQTYSLSAWKEGA